MDVLLPARPEVAFGDKRTQAKLAAPFPAFPAIPGWNGRLQKQPQHLQPCGSSIPILFLLLIQPRASNRGSSAAPEPANPGRSGASPDPIPNDQKTSEGEGNPQITSPHPGAEQEELNFGITRQELLQILFVQSCLNPPVQPFRCLLTRLGRENEFKT